MKIFTLIIPKNFEKRVKSAFQENYPKDQISALTVATLCSPFSLSLPSQSGIEGIAIHHKHVIQTKKNLYLQDQGNVANALEILSGPAGNSIQIEDQKLLWRAELMVNKFYDPSLHIHLLKKKKGFLAQLSSIKSLILKLDFTFDISHCMYPLRILCLNFKYADQSYITEVGQ